MSEHDQAEHLAQRITEAAQAGTPLRLHGADTRDFLGRETSGTPLDLSGHRGIVNYEPTELIVTARAGTPLDEIEAALAEQGQMMPFEPPRFGAGSTLGGAVATGLSGPRRPWAGAARDLVLGTRVVNGKGEYMRFGGEVMKNVAGYDVSRLVTGSYGTLGAILEVSMKVLPLPEAEASLTLDMAEDEGFRAVETAYRDGVPVSGAAHDGRSLHVRLSGTRLAVDAGLQRFGGDRDDDPAAFWHALRDHRLTFFTADGPPLWRLSLPMLKGAPELPGERLADWNGQLHWVRTDAPAADVFREAARLGGHAALFRGGDGQDEVFQPLPAPVRRLHEQVKAAFDPNGILNPGRLYAGL